MTLHVCSDCGTAYLAAPQCPHCGGGSFRFDWEEEGMPKITVDGGPSAYNDETPAPVAETPKPAPKPKPAPAAADN